ncbi:MAG: sulfide/dihydroorotate dehydrogenase-like FAD/NAD-binding protein [Candidatus Omnitrophica bacterium]|jgi:ferredoxin--NADP+ reductase|nr:sulfide/dihydroorotate dehydrogenase-like FAD/NAD-binding protein [Candidatus Omnitrophota bacterium]MDD4012702.1 sulfide/dihydroorotate dehydrogenase-like FAD/NAD-binding protein [Candidatus Omnitrophota bacterium]
MHNILKKKQLNSEICLIEFEAADIAQAASAGQFVILRVDENGERFPLTIYDYAPVKGTITVVCQAIGVSTKKLCSLREGDQICDIAGPLGHPVHAANIGRVVCIGGGVGTAEAYPIAKTMIQNGNNVTVIIGSRNRDLLICEEEIRSFCRDVRVTTDDGSYGRKGFVTDVLAEILSSEKIDQVYAIGPVPMMKRVAEVTRPYGVKTLVSLNSIMIDGTGMCGGCRVKVDSKTQFTCVDGPEFDGHLVDFNDLTQRLGQYKNKEKESLSCYAKKCRIGLGEEH